MAIANIYLTFDGNCEEAFDFYKSVLGGEFSYSAKFKEMPPQEGMPPIPEEHLERLMHISLPLSSETILMGSDTGGEWASDFKMGNNFSVSLTATTKDEADKLFNGLSEGGNISMPMGDTFWGDYFGSFTDKFGVNWMVSFNENPPGK